MRLRSIFPGIVLVLAGCGVTPGGGTRTDAGSDAGDGSRTDGSVTTETGPIGTDSGMRPDTAVVPDGAGGPDVVVLPDGAVLADVVLPSDAAGPREGGTVEGGVTPDGGERVCTRTSECGRGFRCAARGCDGPGVCVLVPPTCTSEQVCGCNGRTYASACEADAADVRVASTGPCGSVLDGGVEAGVDGGLDGSMGTRCTNNAMCNRTEYCATALGACFASGSCTPRPEACTADINPVCGCDGMTYSNACVAAAAGINVASRGACGSTVGDAGSDAREAGSEGGVSTRCTSNAMCAASEYCERTSGACDAAGTCVARPDICTRELVPVCGCDGMTYSNACLARRAGVTVAYAGECRATAGCASNVECIGRGQYCQHPSGMCSARGTCALMPSICPDLRAPVCGCDGMTYGNACQANAAGQSVAYDGACTVSAGCTNDRECGSDTMFCQFATGTCGGRGTCTARAMVCPDVWAPVCGCNGRTYGNSCEAQAAGQSVQRTGACEAVCVAPRGCCGSDRDCATGSYCAGSGAATCTGVCKTRPDVRSQCWRDADCSTGMTCVGANICPCGASCIVADSPGRCSLPI